MKTLTIKFKNDSQFEAAYKVLCENKAAKKIENIFIAKCDKIITVNCAFAGDVEFLLLKNNIEFKVK